MAALLQAPGCAGNLAAEGQRLYMAACDAGYLIVGAEIIPADELVYTISDWISGPDFSFRRLIAFDVSDPTQPVLARTRDLPPYAAVTVSGGSRR